MRCRGSLMGPPRRHHHCDAAIFILVTYTSTHYTCPQAWLLTSNIRHDPHTTLATSLSTYTPTVHDTTRTPHSPPACLLTHPPYDTTYALHQSVYFHTHYTKRLTPHSPPVYLLPYGTTHTQHSPPACMLTHPPYETTYTTVATGVYFHTQHTA